MSKIENNKVPSSAVASTAAPALHTSITMTDGDAQHAASPLNEHNVSYQLVILKSQVMLTLNIILVQLGNFLLILQTSASILSNILWSSRSVFLFIIEHELIF